MLKSERMHGGEYIVDLIVESSPLTAQTEVSRYSNSVEMHELGQFNVKDAVCPGTTAINKPASNRPAPPRDIAPFVPPWASLVRF